MPFSVQRAFHVIRNDQNIPLQCLEKTNGAVEPNERTAPFPRPKKTLSRRLSLGESSRPYLSLNRSQRTTKIFIKRHHKLMTQTPSKVVPSGPS